MAAHVAHVSSVVTALAGPAVKMRGAGPANPVQDFGPLWTIAVALNIVNTVIVLYYLARIWMPKEPTRRATSGAR